ncbi:MAG: phospho-N-acetylmuramoyl-pentapeptide-transferase [Candidatus Midichloriaceae bacterium]|jgi:phospho-N-acetylmuramoyl-pentapeptide-transferase
MLQLITEILAKYFSFFNIFKYITFRSGGAFFTSFFIMLFYGKRFIALLKTMQKHGQPIRDDGPKHHQLTKTGTPFMGGILIIISILISTFLWAKISNPYVLLLSFTLVSFGLLGAIDDYKKLKHNNTIGLSGRNKLYFQIILSLMISVVITYISKDEYSTMLVFPFFKNAMLDIGIFYFVFAVCVITGSSNAVNLTDGLDGLAIGPIIIVIVFFAIISYLVGNVIFANYLKLLYIKNTGEIAVFCSALVGAGLGFLWYNAPPAKVFMGDTGSLSLGAVMGTISVITKNELILLVVGFVFVIEALSVIIQVISYKLYKKRIFQMAPIHHHFEKKGWSESTVVVRFWIVSIISAILGLISLKIR